MYLLLAFLSTENESYVMTDAFVASHHKHA